MTEDIINLTPKEYIQTLINDIRDLVSGLKLDDVLNNEEILKVLDTLFQIDSSVNHLRHSLAVFIMENQ